MKKILSYNKFNFLNEEFKLIKEDSEFNQFQFGIGGMNPMGPGQGFATDPSMSIYTSQDSPYVDYYSRISGVIANLKGMMKQIFNTTDFRMSIMNIDYFAEDVEQISNFKIIRILENYSRNVDVYISFHMKDEEYFGVFKDFNKLYQKPVFKSEIFSDPRFNYINKEYKLKLENLFFKVLKNWFKPNVGIYKNLKENNILKDEIGKEFPLKSNLIVEVIGVENETEKNIIWIKYKDTKYFINDLDYYYFNYRFEKIIQNNY
jgi:hypothetical protein